MTENELLAKDLDDVCKRLLNFKDGIDERSIFLVGCTGFIGRWIIDSLHWASTYFGYKIRLNVLVKSREQILRRIPVWRDWKEITFIEGRFPYIPEETVPNFDLAIHGVTLHDDSSPLWASRLCTTLCSGSENFMKLANKKGCRRILYLSSGAVYRCSALSTKEKLTEEAHSIVERLSQSSLYGESKRFLELFLVALGQRYNIDIPVARCFTFCGRYLEMNNTNALSSFILDLLNNKDIVIAGDGLAIRSFLYGSDMAVFLLALLSKGRNGIAYNVGSSNGVTISELAKIIKNIVQYKKDIKILGGDNKGNAPSRYIPDIHRIQTEFDLKETVNLCEGIYRTIIWAQSCNTIKNNC